MRYDADEESYDIYEIAKMIGFTVIVQKSTNTWSNDYKKCEGEFVAPKNDLFFEVKGKPSRKGTIGRLVNATIDSKWSSSPDTWYLAFDDRKNILKFDYWTLKYLENHEGPTVYNYVAKKPQEADPIPDITNKFGQTFAKGDLVIAIGGTKGYAEIVLGNVTRWTKAGTLFLKPYGPFGSITNQTKGDIQITRPRQTIIVPEGADLEADLFTIVLGSDYK